MHVHPDLLIDRMEKSSKNNFYNDHKNKYCLIFFFSFIAMKENKKKDHVYKNKTGKSIICS